MRASLALGAAAVLAATVLGPLALTGSRDPLPGLAGEAAAHDTTFLQAASCDDWRSWGAGRRASTVRALETAATRPDPESRGATLDRGAAYAVFGRACATRSSSSVLLYEIYNRAASLAVAASAPSLGGFGYVPHR